MNKFLSKTLVACAVTAAIGFSGAAMAQQAQFAPFTISPNILDANLIAPFPANDIIGGYNERLTVNTAGTGFNVSLYWNASSFGTLTGVAPNDTLNYAPHGLGTDYGLYVVYTGQGTISGNTLSFTPGGSFSAWLDKNNDTGLSFAGNGGTPVAVSGGGDDVLLATGAPVSGTGTLRPELCTGSQIGCGFFLGSTSFNTAGSLNGTAAQGGKFFTAPAPFYNLSFQSGQFDNLNTTGGATSNIKGSLDITFANAAAVPEPGSVVLVGLGMVGLYLSRRRKQA